MAAVGREDFAGNLICSLDCPDYSVRAGGYPDAGQAVQFVFGDQIMAVYRQTFGLA